ncbi:methylmalonyl Co-A mutase-associated GTPase MeaB [Methylomonas sp. UP202]|uniref:methylmalonyl Co-A mutase-associated GTPase MeaB n=1 Tax=Methylomonas sp. UP202 TaxID=3040943 RepID=UPI00247AB3BB|nr:methylmalonyl Co-A mutase-associated GTPase MeaB [Methylomonas sp. UP202]WGS86352.1 methylmalonyl Co-A mutase-associated GTPase MeaB [Methylomonas sp. UP202]
MPVLPNFQLNREDQALVGAVLAGQRRALAKTITLIESTRSDHRQRAGTLLHALLPNSGNSIRLGISGTPGVGKSTFIEALGLHLIEQGHRVAVLAVDPSSSRSGGSILGDKTRMELLSARDEAFIRPSPSSGSLGGVAASTREAMLVCEAAGFDVIIVETVGVGQSETAVAGMTDAFCLLQQPNAGDDLQAMKKGIVELADIFVVNKADLDPVAADLTAGQITGALTLLRPSAARWQPPVLKVSAALGEGIGNFWQQLGLFRQTVGETGELAAKRRHQSLSWMWALIESGLHERFRENPGVRAAMPDLSAAVENGSVSPTLAAHRLLELMGDTAGI